MKYLKQLAIVAAFTLMCSYGAFAKDSNRRSVTITDPVQIGSSQLKPGHYQMEWQGTGPAVQVSFMRDGKTVATAPATLQTNDAQVTQDDLILDKSNTKVRNLKEIDFAHQKEAFVFAQNGM